MLKFRLILTVLMCPMLLLANESQTSSRTERLSFPIGQYTEFELESKHGDITIETWDVDSVSIVAVVTATSDNTLELSPLLNMVRIESQHQGDYIMVELAWHEEKNVFQKGAFKFNKKFLGGPRIEVDFTIKVPRTLDMSIDHRFGNIFMGSHKGELRINLEHGDFRARDLEKVKEIEMKYGHLKVRNIDKGRLKLGYLDEARIESAGELNVVSSSSSVSIEEVGTLTLDSRHDEWTIEKVDVIQGSLTLTDIQIDKLSKSSRLITRFGKVYMSGIQSAVEQVDLEGSGTDFFLTFVPEAAGSFEVEVSLKKEFLQEKDMMSITSSEDGEKVRTYQGELSGQAGKTQVKVIAKNGQVSFGS